MALTTLPIAGQDLSAFAYESVTVADASIGFTAGEIAPAGARPAHKAFVTAETAEMRFRYDGTAPTSTEGHILGVAESVEIEGIANVSNFRAIRTGATSGVLKCTFERFF